MLYNPISSRKSTVIAIASPLLRESALLPAFTPLNYHPSTVATAGELFNRSEKAAAIVLWCSTDRQDRVRGAFIRRQEWTLANPARESEKGESSEKCR
jgi:hypothetical protein